MKFSVVSVWVNKKSLSEKVNSEEKNRIKRNAGTVWLSA